MESNLYKKIYIITLCNFWYIRQSQHHTQHIQKLNTEDLWILRYPRSRFFTFLFFMPKISRNNQGEYNKSCSSPYQESSKIDFAIFWIFYDFLGILQVSSIPHILLKLLICTGTPRSFFSFTTMPLDYTEHP
jgi:hypothetical protein